MNSDEPFPDLPAEGEAAVVGDVLPLVRARDAKNDAARDEKLHSDRIRAHLQAQPADYVLAEGETGFAVKLGHGSSGKWCEWASVPDDTLLWAARMGLVTGLNTKLLEALRGAMTPTVQAHLLAIAPHVHDSTYDTVEIIRPAGEERPRGRGKRARA